jgi:hypothetical protein
LFSFSPENSRVLNNRKRIAAAVISSIAEQHSPKLDF